MKRGYLLPEGCKDLIDAWKVGSHGLSKRLSPSEWRDKLKHLKDEYSKRLADPDLNDSDRVKLEWILKELRDHLGEGD